MIKVTHCLLAIMIGIGATSSVLHATEFNNRDNAGAVFVMTNDAGKNQVIAFERNTNGTLGESTSYDTHGRGSGGTTDPLESQGSLTLSQDHSLLFAVNAGSGSVSVFSVHKALLTFLNKAPSGGAQPSAVAEHGGLVYVLNSGGAGSLVGLPSRLRWPAQADQELHHVPHRDYNRRSILVFQPRWPVSSRYGAHCQ